MTGSAQPNPGAQDWFAADHAQLVTTKGWKGPNDVLASYAQLESHVGAPADRLIRIPDAAKIDDAFRGDVFKRIGYTPPRAPEKWEDYGLAVPDGMDDTYMKAIAAEAHKLGITKEQMQGLAALNHKFVTDMSAKDKTDADAKAAADEETRKTRRAAMEGKLKERFGDKYEATSELMTREALRLGYTAEELESFENAIALNGENDLLRFRSLLADLAEVRRESPLHNAGGGAKMTAEQAKEALATKEKDQAWVAKALTRGTPEALENLRLNAIAAGKEPSEAELERLSKGLTAQVQA